MISNRKNAYGLERATRAGIPTLYHDLLKYKKNQPPTDQGMRAAREEYDTELAKLVLQDAPALVVCLGFLHVLRTSFLDPIDTASIKIINIHRLAWGILRIGKPLSFSMIYAGAAMPLCAD